MTSHIFVLLFTLSCISNVFAQSPDTLYAILDMRESIAMGWLNPANEFVGIRGDSPFKWDKTTRATDKDGDGVFELRVPFLLKQDSLVIRYKIKVDGINNPNSGWQTGPNHRITLRRNKENRIELDWYDQSVLTPENIQYAEIKLDFPIEEFQQRRKRAMEVLPDGLIIFQARHEQKSYTEHAILQNPNFYYFTGLNSVLSSILVMDSKKMETWLFTPSDLYIRDLFKPWALLEISDENEKKLQLDHIVDWNAFTEFIDRRVAEDPNLKLYTEIRNGPEYGPGKLNQIEDSFTHALMTKWPDTPVESAIAAISLRLVKSDAEIDALRTVGKLTVDAFLASIKQVKPGMSTRELQGIIIRESTKNKSNGIYAWPFIGSGEYSIYHNLRPSFMDYTLFNHTLKSGELLRIDMGCDYNHYKSDFGRSIPVSGKYTEGQKEVWDAMISGYFAGLEIIKDGVSKWDVFKAFDEKIASFQGKMKTDLGKKAIDLFISDKALKYLLLHTIGIGGYEGPINVCRTGMVLMWEPMFAVDNHGFFLEEMILITDDGYEVLTPAVPYWAEDIEKAMQK